MINTPFDMRYIYKRERFLEKQKSISESAKIPDLSNSKFSNDYRRMRIENFLKECSSYKDAVYVLESLYKDNKFDVLEMATQKVINDIIPMIELSELPGCISFVTESNIGDINKDRIIETAKIYKSADRIRNNHKNISKRFDLSEINHLSNRVKCFRICEMVDTYNLSKFIKFNIALEELAYLGFINGNRMPDKVMVENVSDYFLMIDDNTANDIASYKKAIESSKVISEGADEFVPYIMHSTNHSQYWIDRLNEWKVSTNKSVSTLVEIAKDNFSDITVLNSIVSTINEYCKINNIEFDTMSIFKENNGYINGGEAHNIINFIEENDIENAEDLIDNMGMIWESELNDNAYDDGTKEPETFTSNEIDKFKMHNLIVDSQTVGEFLDQLEKTSMKESPNSIEKILSFKNIDINESNIIDNIDSNGYISSVLRRYSYKGMTESLVELLESSIKCLNNILYTRPSCAYYTIYDEGFDIGIRSKYKIILSEAQEMHRGFSASDKKLILDINRFTNSLENIYESRLLDIVDKLSSDKNLAASIDTNEAVMLYDILNPFSESEGGFLSEFIDSCRYEANPKFDQIKNECSYIDEECFTYNDDNISRINFCADMLGIDEAKIVNNAIDNIKNAVKDITGKNKNNQKLETINDEESDNNSNQNTNNSNDNSSTNTNKNANNKKNMNSNSADNTKNNSNKKQNSSSDKKQNTSNNEENNNSDDQNTNEDGTKDKKAINSLNDAKLAWQGVKAKLKGASAKEQEMSRDLDLEFNHMLKTIKSIYGTDHREEIITGEVNPSLSKAIKMAIGLAGAGAAVGAAASTGILASAAVAPIIGAVVLFAKSKHTSVKEKKLIIDEIDTELQVLDREIQRAEQSGSTKKYRQLLTIQKNLMRRRQEIYYGMAQKGQRMPMQATVGMRPRE